LQAKLNVRLFASKTECAPVCKQNWMCACLQAKYTTRRNAKLPKSYTCASIFLRIFLCEFKAEALVVCLKEHPLGRVRRPPAHRPAHVSLEMACVVSSGGGWCAPCGRFHTQEPPLRGRSSAGWLPVSAASPAAQACQDFCSEPESRCHRTACFIHRDLHSTQFGKARTRAHADKRGSVPMLELATNASLSSMQVNNTEAVAASRSTWRIVGAAHGQRMRTLVWASSWRLCFRQGNWHEAIDLKLRKRHQQNMLISHALPNFHTSVWNG
jgi:hypothetical protein